MEKAAIFEQTKEHLLWANNMLEVQNEALVKTCADLRAKNEHLTKENEVLKTNIAVLKCTVQRISGV
jgi:cell division protein FtsB